MRLSEGGLSGRPLLRASVGGLLHALTSAAAFALLSGCSAAPSRNILGSYFPTWMICLLIAIGLTIVVRVVLGWVGLADELPAPMIVYLAFTLAFTFGLWLLWLR